VTTQNRALKSQQYQCFAVARTQEVRLESSTPCTSVQQALILSSTAQKPCNRNGCRVFSLFQLLRKNNRF
jgi:hypothetical protein